MMSKIEMILSLYFWKGEDIQENANRFGLSMREVQELNERLLAFQLTGAKLRASV